MHREVLPHVSRHYPAFLVTQGSCVNPKPSHRLVGITLGQQAFAGHCQPRLGVGPSQCYSANLSPRAWTSTPAAPVVHLPVSSHKTSAFPPLGQDRRSTTSVQRFQYGLDFGAAVILLCSGPQVCSPSRSLLPQHSKVPGSHDFYVRAYHGLLPPRAADMLAV